MPLATHRERTPLRRTRTAGLVPPARIVPLLADGGSESSMMGVLRERGQNARRSRADGAQGQRATTRRIGPVKVWCWNMTYLDRVMGCWFPLYLDLYSRNFLSAEVHDSDDADHAVHFWCVARHWLRASLPLSPSRSCKTTTAPPRKATTLLPMLQRLGVKPPYSRPRVSDDNVCADPLFRTAKYRLSFLSRASRA